jgi:hypothetical protein
MMLIDSFVPEGVTMLAVDSIFMMPQLGVLSEVLPRAATEVFDKDCLIRLGSCIAPVGQGREGQSAASLTMSMPDGKTREVSIEFGRMQVIPLGVGEKARATLKPAKNVDVGAGPGKSMDLEVEGGVVGVVLDGRGRPFVLPANDADRVRKLQEWAMALTAYPDKFLSLGR